MRLFAIRMAQAEVAELAVATCAPKEVVVILETVQVSVAHAVVAVVVEAVTATVQVTAKVVVMVVVVVHALTLVVRNIYAMTTRAHWMTHPHRAANHHHPKASKTRPARRTCRGRSARAA